MIKIIDDFGYIIKISEENMKAITLVDNGIDPYKNLKNKDLQHKVRHEYKQRLIINIMDSIKNSLKIRNFFRKKLHIKAKNSKSKDHKHKIHAKLESYSMKKLDNLYKQILQHGRTKKSHLPKSSKTRKSRK
jgi:hypothetical protein